jgi:hypothetical protein
MPETNLNPEMSPADKQMADLIDKKVTSFNDFRRAASIEIRANIAYLCGFQNIQILNNQIQQLPESYQTPVVANRILPAVVNDIATASRAMPKFDIVPTSTDEADKATAKACDKILPYLQRINGQDFSRKACVLWYDIAGIGWRKVWWDQYYRVTGNNTFPEDPNFDPSRPPFDPDFQGEAIVEHIPNTEMVFDWRTKDLRRLEWVIHHKKITVGEVRKLYGQELAEKVGHDDIGNDYNPGSFELDILSDFSTLTERIAPMTPSNGGRTGQELLEDKLVDYYEFWHVRNKNMPLGAYAVKIGTEIAVNQPYPIETYPHGDLPFVPASPIPLSGVTVRSISRISQARPLQREYNRLRSMILDNIDAVGNSVIMVQRNSKINFKKIDNRAGNIIEYDGTFKPTREPGVPISSAIFAYMDEVKRSIDEVFSFPEPSRGIRPTGVDSAKGLLALQDAAQQQFGPMIDGLDAADEKVVHQLLSLAVANYGTRLISVVGKDNAWTLEKIDSNELHGKFSVTVRMGSSMPTSKAVEADKTFALWQSGILGDPASPQVRNYVLKQMDVGGIDNILQLNSKHVAFAQKEFINAESIVQRIPSTKGVPFEMIADDLAQNIFVPPPNVFDIHEVHIEEHTNFLLDKYWEYIGTGEVQWKILADAMLMHIQMHSNIISQTQAASGQQMTQMEAFQRGNTMEQILAKQTAQLQQVQADVAIAKIQSDEQKSQNKAAD